MNLFLTSTTIPESAFKRIQELTDSKKPKIGIIDIATRPYIEKKGADTDLMIEQFGELEKVGFDVTRYKYSEDDWLNKLEKNINNLDCLYLSGGNTFVLNFEIQKTRLLSIIQKSLQMGKVVLGSSAGAIVFTPFIGFYESVDDPTKAIERIDTGLSIFPYSLMVHWNNEKYQTELENIETKFKISNKKEIYYIEDTQCIYFDGNNIEYYK